MFFDQKERKKKLKKNRISIMECFLCSHIPIDVIFVHLHMANKLKEKNQIVLYTLAEEIRSNIPIKMKKYKTISFDIKKFTIFFL